MKNWIWKVHCLLVRFNTTVCLCMIKKTLSCQKFDTKNLFNIGSRLWNQDLLHSSMGSLSIVKSIITFHTRQMRWQCAFSKTTKWILLDFTIDSGKSLAKDGLDQVVKDYSNLVWAPRNPGALLPFI